MTIVFLLSDGTVRVPFVKDKSSGRYLSKNLIDLQSYIDTARRFYGEKYIGAFDYFEFRMDGRHASGYFDHIDVLTPSFDTFLSADLGELIKTDDATYRAVSKYSYEDIWYLSSRGDDDPNSEYGVFGIKEEGGWEQRKSIRLIGLLTTINRIGDETRIGQKDPEVNANLLHDCVLLQLAFTQNAIIILEEMKESSSFAHITQRKKLKQSEKQCKAFKEVISLISKYREEVYKNKLTSLEPIISYIQSKIPENVK